MAETLSCFPKLLNETTHVINGEKWISIGIDEDFEEKICIVKKNKHLTLDRSDFKLLCVFLIGHLEDIRMGQKLYIDFDRGNVKGNVRKGYGKIREYVFVLQHISKRFNISFDNNEIKRFLTLHLLCDYEINLNCESKNIIKAFYHNYICLCNISNQYFPSFDEVLRMTDSGEFRANSVGIDFFKIFHEISANFYTKKVRDINTNERNMEGL